MEHAKIRDLRQAVQMGQAAILKHRRILANLQGVFAGEAEIEAERHKLALIEQVHAEDVAELKRLTTN